MTFSFIVSHPWPLHLRAVSGLEKDHYAVALLELCSVAGSFALRNR